MNDLINNLANNNYVIIGLAVLLGLLITLFVVILLSDKKEKPRKDNKTIEKNNDEQIITTDEINFDHDGYIKETTAEFELAPISEINPVSDDQELEVKVEETPARDFKDVEAPLGDFSFDELSKSISEELDKLKLEEENADENKVVEEPTATIPQIREVPVSKVSDINVSSQEPTFIQPDFIINNPAESVQPNFQPEVNKEPVQSNNVVEPVLKENNVPLFARFNQETYDISNKD